MGELVKLSLEAQADREITGTSIVKDIALDLFAKQVKLFDQVINSSYNYNKDQWYSERGFYSFDIVFDVYKGSWITELQKLITDKMTTSLFEKYSDRWSGAMVKEGPNFIYNSFSHNYGNRFELSITVRINIHSGKGGE
jgi:hypothetical protein